MITMFDLQEAVAKGWTGELYSAEFQSRNSTYKDFDHALKHIRKAAQALENMTEKMDHEGVASVHPEAFGENVKKYVADIIISAARLANVAPAGPIDLDAAMFKRLEEKIFPKKP